LGSKEPCQERANKAKTLSNLKVKYQPPSALRPYERNARRHTADQIRRIAKSLIEFGFINPVIVNRTNLIVVGHARVEAAKEVGMEMIPTIQIEDLTEDQIRAYRIADNQLAALAGWDKDILAIELQYLTSIEGLDLGTLTGFDTPEIELFIEGAQKTKPGAEEEMLAPQDPGRAAITKLGDLWHLDNHRLVCGDALKEGSYSNILGNKFAAAVICDSPYNVSIDGHATGKGSIQHREFAMASGEMTEQEFADFLRGFICHLIRFTSPGSVHYLCMDWRHLFSLLGAVNESYGALLNLCVWVKDNGGMGSFYRSQHELVAVARKGSEGHRNNIKLGKFGRNRTNVWHYPGINTMSRQSDEGNLLALHPTVKPVAMWADIILDCTRRGDLVLDPFVGSGTTLIAAEQLGRVCRGIEIDPLYVDTAIRRWQKLTGKKAVHAVERRTFEEKAVEQEANIAS
jgi:DNA modification methylase